MYGFSGYGTNAYGSERQSLLGADRSAWDAHRGRTAITPYSPLNAPVPQSHPLESRDKRQHPRTMILQPQSRRAERLRIRASFTLEDGNGNAVDITDASLTITVQDSQDPTGAALFTGNMTVDSGPPALPLHRRIRQFPQSRKRSSRR